MTSDWFPKFTTEAQPPWPWAVTLRQFFWRLDGVGSISSGDASAFPTARPAQSISPTGPMSFQSAKGTGYTAPFQRSRGLQPTAAFPRSSHPGPLEAFESAGTPPSKARQPIPRIPPWWLDCAWNFWNGHVSKQKRPRRAAIYN
jgi:hypothetical protein